MGLAGTAPDAPAVARYRAGAVGHATGELSCLDAVLDADVAASNTVAGCGPHTWRLPALPVAVG